MPGRSRAVVVALVLLALVAGAVGPATAQTTENSTQAPENDTANNSTASPNTGPYSLEELDTGGKSASEDAPASVRRYGDGQLWLRYAPSGITGSAGNPDTYQYIEYGTTVRRTQVYLGGFLGWDADPADMDVTIVYWKEGTRQVAGPNGTTQTVPAAVNQSVQETTVTLEGGYVEKAVGIRSFYDESRRATVFVEGPDGSAVWGFKVKTSPTTKPVNVDTAGDLALWALLFLGLAAVATLIAMYLAKRAHKKAGKGPGYPIWLYLAGAMPIGFVGFVVGYRRIISTVAQAPWILVPAVALVSTIAAINWWGDDTDRVGIIHVDLTSPNAHEDGSGEIPVDVRSFEVASVGGVEGVVTQGITPYLARARGAIPELELWCFGEEMTTDPTIDFPGRGAYDRVYFADPMKSQPIEMVRESWSLSHIYNAPELEEDAETVDRLAAHLSAVAWERIGGALGILLVGWTLGGALVASSLVGFLAAVIPAGMWLAQPVKGKARWHVAPASFASVLLALVNTTEEFDETAEKEWYKSKYFEELGTNVADHKLKAEESELSRFEQVMERINGDDVPEEMRAELDQDATQAEPGAADDD